MSKRFRYLVLATALSLGMWVGIITGSMAIFNSVAAIFAHDDLHALSGQVALQVRDADGRDVVHE